MQPFAFLKDFTAGGTLFAAMIAVVLPSSAEAADLIINGSGSTVSISSGTTSYESITVGESSLATSNTLSIPMPRRWSIHPASRSSETMAH